MSSHQGCTHGSFTIKLEAGLQVCQEQEKGVVQTGQLPAGPSPRGIGRAEQLVCRQQSLSARALGGAIKKNKQENVGRGGIVDDHRLPRLLH